jgi:conjugative relaxase-like TrwC/TraI family protein
MGIKTVTIRCLTGQGMLTISKSLSAGQARTYHAREFISERQNYWSQDQQGHSEWQGSLAKEWGLHGNVGAEEFARLSEGRHPANDAQLVKHQPARTYENQYGKQITSSEHRAGWDATFSAPKSVSLTALVGGDDRVREAHRESVRVALQELERYTQARIGNVHAPETTGKFVAATFEHDTARPVDGYAAPQLHTHAVVFNVTERDNGQTRALQERSLFQSQQYATTVYRSELALKLQGLGYEIERGKHGQPEIKGYSQEYLEASSPRRVQIKEHLQEIGREGAGAAQVAAHRTRDSKELHSPEEVLQRHRELAARFGHQADRVVAKAQGQHHEVQPEKMAQQSVTYSRNHVFERSAVQDERAILQAAIDRSMGQASYSQVRQEFEQRVARGEFRAIARTDGRAAPLYTTAEMMRMEREIVGHMQRGNQWSYSDPMLVSSQLRIWTEDRHPELNRSQRKAVDEIFISREKIVGLDGVAGAGKSYFCNFLLQNAQKYAPLTFIFDIGGSFQSLTTIFGGSYLNVGQETRDFTINPFSLAPTKENLQFLFSFFRVLIEGAEQRYRLDFKEERKLWDAIERVYVLEPGQRTISSFVNIIGELKERLHRWTEGGQYGFVFDNPEDTLSFSRFQTFNFAGWGDAPEVLEPLLFYVLHRSSNEIANPQKLATFKMFLLDEAWLFIKNETIRTYIVQAQKTWRKHNAAMILATQSIKELEESGMLQIVSESCPTKIFLANPEMDRDLYREAFHLNDTELELIAGLVPPGQMLIRKAQSSKKVQLSVDSVSHWTATNNARDNLRKREYFERYGIADGLRRLAEDHPFRPRTMAVSSTTNR